MIYGYTFQPILQYKIWEKQNAVYFDPKVHGSNGSSRNQIPNVEDKKLPSQ